MNDSIKEIIDFWYVEETIKRWFKSTPAFDLEIKQRFESIWLLANDNKLNDWKESPLGCLALCIVLDQFPLNMYRGELKSFQTESLAIDVAKEAITKGFDNDIDEQKVSFLYMPLMHSENLADQDLCIACFEKRGLDNNVRFAQHHRGLIAEFGRFPHRNESLGRESSEDEIAYLNSKRAFTG